MHTEYINEFDKTMMDGLLLLGWQDSVRFTTEDRSMLMPICEKAIRLSKKGKLTPDSRDELSLKAYGFLYFQVVGVQERADYISLVYYNSKYFRPLINLIDEATLCFYRGYNTAALSLLFITLESYLRAVYNWSPGDRDPSFVNLKNAVLTLPDHLSAKKAFEIINVVYSRYEAVSPTQFEFNRHGLLHGVRGPTKFDEMNCARIFQLFDILCAAEGVDRTGFGIPLEMFKNRYKVYENCRQNKLESMLTRVIWKDLE